MTPDTFTDWSEQEGHAFIERTVSWSATGDRLQVILSRIDPGKESPPHKHPHEQFCVILEGTFEFDVEGCGSRALGPRGVFYFAPNQAHGGRVVGDEPVMMLEAFHPIRLDYVPGRAADHDRPQ